jgi:hypothetical protein
MNMGILTGRDQCLGQGSAEFSPFRVQYAMANDNKPQKDRAAPPAREKNMKAPAERPFDMWLHKQLHAMYDEIAAEPLPDDLINLIENDAGKKDTPPGDKK